MIFFITNKEPVLNQIVASSSSQKRSTSAPTKKVGSEPAMERPTLAPATEVGSGTNQKRFNRRYLKLIILFNSIDKKIHLD